MVAGAAILCCMLLASGAWAGTPNLTQTTPGGWAGPIVVSTVTGTNTNSTNNPAYTSANTLYVDIAVRNVGDGDATPFYVIVQVDGYEPATGDGVYRVDGLAAGATWTREDINIGSLASGIGDLPATHSIRVIIDPQGVQAPPDPPYAALNIAETNETDNEVTKTINVHLPLPVITSGNTTTGTAGTPWQYQIEAMPLIRSYSANNLPWWASIDISSGMIGGTCPVQDVGPGLATFTFDVGATNASGTTWLRVRLTISPVAPVIDSPLQWYGRLGEPIAPYNITYQGSRSTLTAQPLPMAGLVFNSPTISGTPIQAGTIIITMTATNAGGTDVKYLRIDIAGPPVITSDLSVAGQANPGVYFAYQIVATGFPHFYAWEPARIGGTLPPGLNINADSGLISGTPTTPGTYECLVYATNKYGSGTATLVIGIKDGVKPAIISPITIHAFNGVGFYYFMETTPPPPDNTNWFFGNATDTTPPPPLPPHMQPFQEWRTVPLGQTPPIGATHMRYEFNVPMALAAAPRTVSICDVPRVGPIRTNNTGELIGSGGIKGGPYILQVRATYLDMSGVEQSTGWQDIWVIIEDETPHIITSKLGMYAKKADNAVPPGTPGGGDPNIAFQATLTPMIWATNPDPFGIAGQPTATPPQAQPVSPAYFANNVLTVDDNPHQPGAPPAGLYWNSLNAIVNPFIPIMSWEIDPWPYIPVGLRDGDVHHDVGAPSYHVHSAPKPQHTFTTIYAGDTMATVPLDNGGYPIVAVDMWTDGVSTRNDGLTGLPNPDLGNHTPRYYSPAQIGLIWDGNATLMANPLTGPTMAGLFYVRVHSINNAEGLQLDGYACATIRIEHTAANTPIIQGPTAYAGQLDAPFTFSIGAVNGGAILPMTVVSNPPLPAGVFPAGAGFAGTVTSADADADGTPGDGIAGPYHVTFDWIDNGGRYLANNWLSPDTVQRRPVAVTMVFYNQTNDKPRFVHPVTAYATEKVPFAYKVIATQFATRIEAIIAPTAFTFPPGVPTVTYPTTPAGLIPLDLRMDPLATVNSSNVISGTPVKGSSDYYPNEEMRPRNNWLLLRAQNDDGKVGFGVVNILTHPAPPNVQPTMDFSPTHGFNYGRHISMSMFDIVTFPPAVPPSDHPEYTINGFYPRVANGRQTPAGTIQQGFLIQAPRSGGGFVLNASDTTGTPPGRGPAQGDSRDLDTYWDNRVMAPYDSNWGRFYYAINLPAGMSVGYLGTVGTPGNQSGGMISGTLQTVGHNEARVSAQNSFGADSRMVTFGALPVEITSPMTDIAYVGTQYEYFITGTGLPYTYWADGLPPGLTIDSNTGRIFGVPLQPSDELNPYGDPGLPLQHFEIMVYASNRWSTGVRSLDLTVTQDRKIPLIVDALKAPNRQPFLAVGFDGRPFYAPWQPTRTFTDGIRNASDDPARPQAMTISDGVTTRIFEFDSDLTVTPGRVGVSIGPTPSDTLVNLAAAIQANLQINTVIPRPGSTILLTNRNVGAAGNQEILTNVPAIFAVGGMLFGDAGNPAKGVITFVRDGPYYPPPPGLLLTANALGPIVIPVVTNSPLLVMVKDVDGGTPADPSIGRITMSNEVPWDGDTVRVSGVTFEFDTNNVVTPGNIRVSLLRTDGQPATRDIVLAYLRDAINAAPATGVAASLDDTPGYRISVASNPPDPRDPNKPLWPPHSYSALGLPPGLSIDQNTGLIAGTPIGYGEFDVTVTVANVWGVSGVVLHISIKPVAPTITSTNVARGIVGLPFNTWDNAYTITATGSAGILYTVDSLPTGLQLNGATITGSPTVAGPLSPDGRTTLPQVSTITASNAGGSVQFQLSIYIYQRPTITNNPPAFTATVGEAFTGTLTFGGSPDQIMFILGSALPNGINQQPFPNTGLLQGTPEVPGVWNVPVYVQNICGPRYVPPTQTDFTFTINAMVITSPLLHLGVVGQPLTPYQITATGNPTSYSATGLPAGVAFDPGTGRISGVPTEAGSFPVYIEASNAYGRAWAWLNLGIASVSGAPVITSPLVATGYVNSQEQFSYLITATNNPTAFDAAPLDPNFPALTLADLGLAISHGPTPNDPGGVNGLLSGTPLVAGTFQIQLSATNAVGTAYAMLTLAISSQQGAPAITSPLTDLAMVGADYSYVITGSNGPTNFTATGLPPGLGLADPTSGTIQGVPTQAGTFPILLTAFNQGGEGSATFNLTVMPAAPPVITSPGAATGAVGVGFQYLITAPFATSYGATNLPPGLNLTGNVITGQPLLAGVYTVTVTASNSHGTSTLPVVVTINAVPGAPVVTSPTAASGLVGQAFSYQIAATNAPNTYNAFPTGAATGLPAGLSLNNTTGLISGTPSEAGTFVIIVAASNGAGMGTAAVSITIIQPSPIITSPSTANGNVGVPLTYQITATGSQPIVFSTSSLPAGLTLTGSVISGVPTTEGVVVVQITAVNGYGSQTQFITFNIGPPVPPNITSGLSLTTFVNLPASYTIVATGSTPMTYGATALPPGMAITANVISGNPTVPGSYAVTLTATNVAGTDTKTLVITVLAVVPGVDTDGDGFSDELEIALGTNPLDPNSTPFSGAPGVGEPFHMPKPKLSIKLNFAKPVGNDMITMTGTLPMPAGFTSPGQTVVINVGGVIVKATLDGKGKYLGGDKTVSVRLGATRASSISQNAKYSVKMKGTYQALLADEGLTNADISKQLREVQVMFMIIEQQLLYQKTQTLLYSAKVNRSGQAK
jgi:PKD repeat protein